MQKQIKVYSNFFQVKMEEQIYKYNITISAGNFTEKIKEIRETIFKNPENQKKIKSAIGESYIFLNNSFYSIIMMEESLEFDIKDTDLKIKIEHDKSSIFMDDLRSNLIGRLIKIIQRKVRLKPIGRKLFNIDKSVKIKSFDIWPGFSTSFVPRKNNKGMDLLNIDIVHKIITNSNVYQFIMDLKRRCSNDFEGILNQELVGKSIMTVYNRRIYRIDKIAFDKTAGDSFTKEDGTKITFADYYLNTYKKKITNLNQILLIHLDRKKNDTTKEIYLIPELCVMTGLNDHQRSDRRLMTSLDKVIKPKAGERLEKCTHLINLLNSNEHSKKLIKEWKIELNPVPMKIDGNQLMAGSLLFAKKEVNINRSHNLDREAQGEMYYNSEINEIVIFYPRRNERELNRLKEMLDTVFTQYRIKFKSIDRVEINDFRKFEEIKEKAKKALNPNVSICFWILPGNKKKGTNYDKIKQFLINNLPVPSQMILVNTISHGKNLRSIVTKMIVQMGAKIGSIPWAINDLPFSDRPTMLIGIDSYGKINSKKGIVYAFVSTTNNTFSNYWSASAFGKKNYSIGEFVSDNIIKAIEFFYERNKIYPYRIIFYREGVSKGQRSFIKDKEISLIKQKRDEFMKKNDIKDSFHLIYICVNKISNAKFFFGDNNSLNFKNVKNPLQGTYLSKNVCDSEDEFYLVSQKTWKGLATPTNYFILENELFSVKKIPIEKVKEDIAKLSFKLCFMYYNTIGGIKVPAPIHYAHKLCNLIGDNSNGCKINPHSHLANIESLYFI